MSRAAVRGEEGSGEITSPMLPGGYMAKRVSLTPEWLAAAQVVDIYSVSGCISPEFADYTRSWKHNGYWLFDTPALIQQVAKESEIDLAGTSLFYYEIYEHEFDELHEAWRDVEPVRSIPVQVTVPSQKELAGYDVVGFSMGTSAECSPLSCCNLAQTVETNAHCLLDSLEQARQLLEHGTFADTEPGPFRILAVYPLTWS